MENTLINKKDKFTQIEHCVLRNPLITVNARMLYGIIVSYDYGKGSAFPSQERLAAEMSLTDRTIRSLLNELRGLGLLSWEQRGLNKPNVYYIEEIPQRIKDEYEQVQTRIKESILDKTVKTDMEKKMIKENREQAIKEYREVSKLAGKVRKTIKSEAERKPTSVQERKYTSY